MKIEPIKQISNQSLLSIHERESLLMDAKKQGKQQIFSESDLKPNSYNQMIYNKLGENNENLLIGKYINKRV